MRVRFADQLDRLTAELSQMCEAVGVAMGTATQAVLDRDAQTMDSVMMTCAEINRRHRDIEREVVGILACQSPVGRDLRAIVSSLHIAADVGRMAGLTRHICEIGIRRSQPTARSLPADRALAAMGLRGRELAESTADVIRDADPEGARRLHAADQTMDALCRNLLDDIENEASGDVGIGVDLALLARFFERFADHAVLIGRRVHFLSTGRLAV